MTEPTPELKPCPFCGGSATIGGLVPWAECTACEASGSSCTDEASAAAAWNRRVAPQPPARIASIPESSPNRWLQAGGLLYRLTEGHRPQNRDEINVTMVHGSRDPAHCEARAAEILAMLQSQPPAEAMEAWHSAMNDVGELRANAPDERYASRAARVESWIKANRPEPPSAPVGVEVASLPALWRLREDNGEEHSEYDKGFETASDECARMLEDALAQQPAAVCHCYTTDPTNCIGTDDLAGLDCPCKCHAQQPAAIGEEIMVNAAHDVYTLPLQPSGLSSGPRFVVHVPAPEQPAAVDASLARRVLNEEHAFLVGLKSAVPEAKRGDVQERIDAVRAALGAQRGQHPKPQETDDVQ